MADAHLMVFPYFEALSNARLDAVSHDEATREFVIDFHELQLDCAPRMFWQDGQPVEELQGQYVPRRLRFSGVNWVQCEGVYAALDNTPLDHSARYLQGVLYWKPFKKTEKLLLILASSTDYAKLFLSPEHVDMEERDGEPIPAHFVHGWSTTPTWSERFMPETTPSQHAYCGNPIHFRVDDIVHEDNLLVGGLHFQGEQRPPVDAVLNVSEEPSAWLNGQAVGSADRWSAKGEGRDGMSIDEIMAEAQWVIDRLRDDQRVLVHCSAGFNRSSTICCAVLILLEDLTAEEALNRVREHHPWSRPDAYHWLKLRWLAENYQP